MATVELFGFAQSTFVRTACMVCEEKGITYDLHPLQFREASHRELHPYLKMPVLRHGPNTLFETLAISIYLNAQFPGADLEASDPVEKALNYQWISVANDYIYKDIVGEVSKADNVSSETVVKAASLLQPFDQALSKHDFLAGDEIRLADLFLFPMLQYTTKAVGNVDWLAELPRVAGWLQRIEDRPSVLRTEA